MEKVNDLKDIAVISGKPGLFKIVKPARNGVIVEAVGNPKIKLITNAGHKVSILKEISVYTTTGEGAVALEEVFRAVRDKYPSVINLAKDAGDAQLRDFMNEILPENDAKRVHISDIKKLISWYNLLAEFFPEVLDPKVETKEAEKENVENLAPVKTEAPKAEVEKPVEKKETKKKTAAKTEVAEAETAEVKKEVKAKVKKEKVEAEAGETTAKKTSAKKA